MGSPAGMQDPMQRRSFARLTNHFFMVVPSLSCTIGVVHKGILNSQVQDAF